MSEPYISLLDKAVNDGIYTEENYEDPFVFASEHCPTEYFDVEQPVLCHARSKYIRLGACYDCWMRPYEGDNNDPLE